MYSSKMVQPDGTVVEFLVIVEVQVASGFGTNVPVDETLDNQLLVYVEEGSVMKFAFT